MVGTTGTRTGTSTTATGFDMPESPAELVDACCAGDQAAWARLIQRHRAVVWTVARSHGLRPADCEDVCQVTWLRVIENIGSLNDPGRLGAWIVTTARREALRVSGSSGRYHLVDDLSEFTHETGHQTTPEETVLNRAEGDLVRKAVRHLPARHQALLGLLLRDPPMSYDAISVALAMPRGSIGPTRNRILRQARDFLRDM
ncbi:MULTISPECIES: RNA polymerase sigma factor [Streptomyces]|uniref:RNA polymerase sigma factor n=1 Tax=Streptomyces lienomycini TaxID=284035 RepID=A0ABV9WT75_9ACTN|nr:MULTISPECIES: sigma-70 family RNA polymerase sigma factor [Streptomyces]